jgi:hypothetical protein
MLFALIFIVFFFINKKKKKKKFGKTSRWVSKIPDEGRRKGKSNRWRDGLKK